MFFKNKKSKKLPQGMEKYGKITHLQQRIIENYPFCKDITKLAKKVDCAPKTIYRVLEKPEVKKRIEEIMEGKKKTLIDIKRALYGEGSRVPRLDNKPELHINNCILFSDLHCPYQNTDWILYMIDVAKKEEIDEAICIGDLVDFAEISRYLQISNQVTTLESITSAAAVIGAIAEQFRIVHVLMGNHDVRLARKLAEADIEEPFDFAWQVISKYIESEKVKLYKHTNMIVHTVSGDYKLVHPDAYSRIAPQVERRLAEKYHANIIGTHGHMVGIGFDGSGKYLAAQIGHMADDRKIEYKQEKVTTHPEWQNAFATLKDGKLKMYIDHPAWRN